MERIGVSNSDLESMYEHYAKKYLVGRVGTPEDIADGILFLASDNSSFTTGTIMVADGGHIAANVEMKA